MVESSSNTWYTELVDEERKPLLGAFLSKVSPYTKLITDINLIQIEGRHFGAGRDVHRFMFVITLGDSIQPIIRGHYQEVIEDERKEELLGTLVFVHDQEEFDRVYSAYSEGALRTEIINLIPVAK